jgi:hypothetical protein
VEKLAEQLANNEGNICKAALSNPLQIGLPAISTMLVLFYLFCEGKTEDNLSHMFNLFDMDGNKVAKAANFITVLFSGDYDRRAAEHDVGVHRDWGGEGPQGAESDELHGAGPQVDLATVMAEMFQIGDKDKNDVLDRFQCSTMFTMFAAGTSSLEGCLSTRSPPRSSG